MFTEREGECDWLLIDGIQPPPALPTMGAATAAPPQTHPSQRTLALAPVRDGKTPLDLLVSLYSGRPYKKSAMKLMEQNFNPDIHDINNANYTDTAIASPLWWALHHGSVHVETIKFLVLCGADLSRGHFREGRSPLFMAITNPGDDFCQLKYLLQQIPICQQFEIMVQADQKGQSPLLFSIWCYGPHHPKRNCLPTIVKLLCEHHPDVDQADKQGNTPLFLAATYGYDDIVRFLVKLGAIVDNSIVDIIRQRGNWWDHWFIKELENAAQKTIAAPPQRRLSNSSVVPPHSPMLPNVESAAAFETKL
jgi:ankyrin repeat protein